ncbi:hypothetical protein [Collimonas humicola]|uniref:hypothetical protein n=1 Tax=Collimonas humicola TaxID=2825886 RepID=UPI001B8AF371|nr:hypothetical protein [Collimonas humicola]
MTDFKLKFYTRRWNSTVTLNVKKTDTGWHISHIAINGDSDPEGAPHLYANLHQDNVKFPHGIGGFLAYIWEQLHNEEIDRERAQQMINQLGEWISTCETSQPVWKTWNA